MDKAVSCNRKNAFTLVELSVVLVVLGLIVGAVFVGGQLVKASKRRTVISEMEQLGSSVIGFKLKYNCLPGDCANMTSLFPGVSGLLNGNGNSRIDSFWSVGSNSESLQFFYHLKQVQGVPGRYAATSSMNTRNFLPGENIMASASRKGVGIGVVYLPSMTAPGQEFTPSVLQRYIGNVYMIGTQQSPGGCCETYAPGYTAADAYNIDLKIDDGWPGKGKMIQYIPLYFGNCVTSADPSVSQYDVTNGNLGCNITMKTPF